MEFVSNDTALCVFDGRPECKKTGKKLRCPCQTVTYCSKECQKLHWKSHKFECATRNANTAAESAGNENLEAKTLAELQQLVSSETTPNGAVIKLQPGVYSAYPNGTVAPLIITRSVTIEGCGMASGAGATHLDCEIIIDTNPSPTADSTLILRNFRCWRGMKINKNNHHSIQLVNLHISLPDAKSKFEQQIPTRGDCVEVSDCNILLISGCQIHGGSDGLGLNGRCKAHILKSEIKYACSRGMLIDSFLSTVIVY